MIGNILGWLVFVPLTVMLGWFALRPWRVKNALLKWGGVVLAGLLSAILALVTVVIGRGLVRIYSPPPFSSAPNLTVARTPDQIARGEHLALSLCAGCHSANGELPLNSGLDVGKDSPVLIGELIAFNSQSGRR